MGKKLTEMTTNELKVYIDQLYRSPVGTEKVFTDQLIIHLLMLLIKTIEETS